MLLLGLLTTLTGVVSPPEPTPPSIGLVPIRFIPGPDNVVPVEIVTVWEAGVVYCEEVVGPANVVPVREAPSEVPRVKIIIVEP